MNRSRRSALLLAAALVALLALNPAAALAHATLEGSSPARGAVVPGEPGEVGLRFSEPVEGNFGALRVYDAEGGRVDDGDVSHPGGEGSRLAVGLEPGLADGSFTATYRVVSADGHVVSGGFVFSIGNAGRAPEQTVAELVAADDSGAADVGLGIARGVQYASLALALGGLCFLLLAWRPALLGRMRRLLLWAALAGLLSALAAIVFHAAEAAGIPPVDAIDRTILREELGTRFGTVWGLTALAWAIVGPTSVPALRGGPRRAALLFVPLAMVVLEPALSGHAGTQSPAALLVPANVLHVLAMSVWVGGLASLVLILPAATRALDPPERTRLLAAILARFSPVALACVAALILTGAIQAITSLDSPADLLDTAYGRAVLAKSLLLLAVLIPLGAHNRYRSLPRLREIAAGGGPPGHAGLVVRRALRTEVGVLAVVIAITAALAGFPPPGATQSGPFSASSDLGPAQLEMTVDPARTGANQIHLYLFDARTGAWFTSVKELGLDAEQPEKEIGPIELDVRRAGPGHFTVQGAPLGVPGEWRLEVTARVSEFDQYTTEIGVPIR